MLTSDFNTLSAHTISTKVEHLDQGRKQKFLPGRARRVKIFEETRKRGSEASELVTRALLHF